MNVVHRERIGRAFSAARDYDRHAQVQRTVAHRLAEQIAVLPLPAKPRILEIGCGTGFLTQALIDHGINGELLITDIAPAMVERCLERVGQEPGHRFEVLDGEYGAPMGKGFDLICSSLVMQWFDDHETALARMLDWLQPGGHLMFTTLGAGSFVEWHKAHEIEGLVSGTPRFPTVAELCAVRPHEQSKRHEVAHYVETHDSAIDFMRSLRAIGANTARHRHRPLQPPQLRRVMRNFEKAGARISYEVVTCHYMRAASRLQ